jgi:hypothetical protein
MVQNAWFYVVLCLWFRAANRSIEALSSLVGTLVNMKASMHGRFWLLVLWWNMLPTIPKYKGNFFWSQIQRELGHSVEGIFYNCKLINFSSWKCCRLQACSYCFEIYFKYQLATMTPAYEKRSIRIERKGSKHAQSTNMLKLVQTNN